MKNRIGFDHAKDLRAVLMESKNAADTERIVSEFLASVGMEIRRSVVE